MERSMRKTSPRRGGLGVVASMVALAFQRRRQWFLLFLLGVGLVAAVTLVCIVPLLTTVMQTAGLREVLREPHASSELTLLSTVAGLSAQMLDVADRFALPPVQDHH